MSSFNDIFETYNWDDTRASIYAKTSADVERALAADKRTLEDFKALVSPAAAPYLEQMAQISQRLTLKRFGKVLQMYVPLYLSNECSNICTYCGFSYDNKVKRKTLSPMEIMQEVAVIKEMGYEHVLLVTGEDNVNVHVDYFKKVLELIRPHFAHISMEVQPMDLEDYQQLTPYGLNTVLVYQETYHKEDYKKHHPKGKKSNFKYRVETPDRLGQAGIHKMGLGVLIGLEDWRTDCFFTAMHLNYLEKKYWQTKYSLSFPRLRPFSGGLEPKVEMNDRELVQLICAYRLFNEEVELSISTRESANFRNNIIKLGITSISAGSKTNPGGYAVEPESLEQFEISDERSPAEIAEIIAQQGYEAVWKDWDSCLN
ncbi:2-iminoacetate synthase ThiH [Mucilaginibacter rubeus]|uniref:2-iminoacetate synthase ThiH n=1 Tax=Mucilaginibacter rubeus TaxID=2027860 RepID=A0AAE6JD93_9SPHI|nr:MULTISPECIES: 2-iminoacetate synthase ThiH [Mucilaginibacter]QEM03478.1 2-iminoacetate synthase ThiH [Mucilaginibacter rubeus]QEM16094.1 2-iminoacetate synthase ThiH [Mucilaginibacter gossypii]QTE41153.1 2-iminoacetate synthase ThiH [Mucilaginibacter rubeus]QTE47757.1 2-iminoacetate synthase ThiH [Mucilaginibacter rubeus]QTE59148.1 2-iminoacetate synthase ThiH [Mucilaginibacter rubeus]